MSTKSSLASGDDFHFYHEAFVDNDVYLELRGDVVEFEAGPRSVTVRIPIHVWEHIRHYGGFTPEYAEMDDAALLDHVTQEVDERIQEWEAAGKSGLSAIFGAAVYGTADEPRDEQIAHGMEYLSRTRAEEREIMGRLRAIRERHAKLYDGSGIFVVNVHATNEEDRVQSLSAHTKKLEEKE